MADTERKPLPGHPTRGPAAASGCASVFLMLFGVPFMGAGGVIALIATGRIQATSSGAPPPPWLPFALAVIFFVPGLFLFLTGLRSLLAGQQVRSRRSQHPEEPWLVDEDWEAEGTGDRPRTTLLAQVLWLAFMVVFLAPFNYFVFLRPGGREGVPFWVRGLIVLFDLIPLLMMVGILTTLWHGAKYGRSRLRFGSFPFFLGGTLDVRFSTRRPIGHFEKMTFTLRCLEERSEVRRTSKGSSTETVCDQIWADERVFESSWALQEGEVPVSFRLPEGDYGTRLDEPPVRYWELEVAAATPGLDFGAVFPVPVYTRPRR